MATGMSFSVAWLAEFLPRDAQHFSAKRGIAIACRLSVCLSVRLSVRPSVRPSVTLVNCDHIGWNSSKLNFTIS